MMGALPKVTRAAYNGDQKAYFEYDDGTRIWLGHTRQAWDGRVLMSGGEFWVVCSNYQGDDVGEYDPIACRVKDLPQGEDYCIMPEQADRISLPVERNGEVTALPICRLGKYPIPFGIDENWTTRDEAEWELTWGNGNDEFPGRHEPKQPTTSEINALMARWKDDEDAYAAETANLIKQLVGRIKDNPMKRAQAQRIFEEMEPRDVRLAVEILIK